MPFLLAPTLTRSPRSSFPRQAGVGAAGGAAGGGGAAGIEVEVAKGAAAAKVAEVVVGNSRHPVCRRDEVELYLRFFTRTWFGLITQML